MVADAGDLPFSPIRPSDLDLILGAILRQEMRYSFAVLFSTAHSVAPLSSSSTLKLNQNQDFLSD